jgi:SagB-type dehydrogenase family enzyme
MLDGNNPEPRKSIRPAQPLYYPVGNLIPLPKANTPSNRIFIEVLGNRISERVFQKMSIQDLSNLLWYAAKIKSVSITTKNQIITHRPSPSAGSLHPIDIFLSLPQTIKKRQLYYYDPFIHKIGRLVVDKHILFDFLSTINDCLESTNATVIWFVGVPQIVSSKYKNHASLLWRDAGSLLMTVHLTAYALGLKSCAVGTLGQPFLSRLFEKNYKIISAGGLLVGK